VREEEEEQEREVKWPRPRKDLDEEPSEPWARQGQHPKRPWEGWERQEDES
jgi:hypothetical protein